MRGAPPGAAGVRASLGGALWPVPAAGVGRLHSQSTTPTTAVHALSHVPDLLGQDWDAYVAARAAAIPVGRAGQPEDVAHTVSFLVSEGAGFVSGQVVYVAGGPRT